MSRSASVRSRDPFTSLGDGGDGYAYSAVVAMVFFSRADHEELLARWPGLVEGVGDWDEHRTGIEQAMVAAEMEGYSGGITPGGVAEFAEYLVEHRVKRPDGETVADYSGASRHSLEVTAWPPDRGAPCWCGSGAKYKRCCRLRGLGSFA